MRTVNRELHPSELAKQSIAGAFIPYPSAAIGEGETWDAKHELVFRGILPSEFEFSEMFTLDSNPNADTLKITGKSASAKISTSAEGVDLKQDSFSWKMNAAADSKKILTSVKSKAVGVATVLNRGKRVSHIIVDASMEFTSNRLDDR